MRIPQGHFGRGISIVGEVRSIVVEDPRPSRQAVEMHGEIHAWREPVTFGRFDFLEDGGGHHVSRDEQRQLIELTALVGGKMLELDPSCNFRRITLRGIPRSVPEGRAALNDPSPEFKERLARQTGLGRRRVAKRYALLRWGHARHLELGVSETGALLPEGGERCESCTSANCANARLHLGDRATVANDSDLHLDWTNRNRTGEHAVK
jgi:hypothetical protein